MSSTKAITVKVARHHSQQNWYHFLADLIFSVVVRLILILLVRFKILLEFTIGTSSDYLQRKSNFKTKKVTEKLISIAKLLYGRKLHKLNLRLARKSVVIIID